MNKNIFKKNIFVLTPGEKVAQYYCNIVQYQYLIIVNPYSINI